jgi:hypothetical protein
LRANGLGSNQRALLWIRNSIFLQTRFLTLLNDGRILKRLPDSLRGDAAYLSILRGVVNAVASKARTAPLLDYGLDFKRIRETLMHSVCCNFLDFCTSTVVYMLVLQAFRAVRISLPNIGKSLMAMSTKYALPGIVNNQAELPSSAWTYNRTSKIVGHAVRFKKY